MRRSSFILVVTACGLLGASVGLGSEGASAARAEDGPSQSSQKTAEKQNKPDKELLTGRVVLLRQALKERGIEASEEMAGQVVLETPQGELIPIVADWRGRAFFKDERLRNRKVQLVGLRQKGVPYVKVLMIFTFDENGRRMYTDYYCDVCNIAMYEPKPCDCCQGEIRLRFQPRELPDYLKDQTAASSPNTSDQRGSPSAIGSQP